VIYTKARTHWGKTIWSSLNSLYNYEALISVIKQLGKIFIYDLAKCHEEKLYVNLFH